MIRFIHQHLSQSCPDIASSVVAIVVESQRFRNRHVVKVDVDSARYDMKGVSFTSKYLAVSGTYDIIVAP